MDTRFTRHIAWTSNSPMGLSVERAEGTFLHLTDGRKIIDLISGIAVSSLGHGHPDVVSAVQEQAARHMHVMVYGEFEQEPQSALAGLLASQLPERLSTVYFTMTGTEANEGALKLSKKFTGRQRMVAFENSYHGDTHGSLSVTGRAVYRDPFLPLLPEVTFLPFNDLEALKEIDSTVACVITEPIQGEGGVRVASKKWLQALQHRCRSTGALLIFDEIQTGMGRTGDLFAFQGFDVEPDIMTVAKAFGGGMPLGGFISRPEIMSCLRENPPLSHVTTFGGHPVSCAAGYAALQVMLAEDLPSRAREIGQRVRSALDVPSVVELRGKGAMLGLQLADATTTARVVSMALEAGVLLGWTLHSDSLIRIAPPLNIPWGVLDEAMTVIREALSKA